LEKTLVSLRADQKISEVLKRLRSGRFRSVVLTGMGSSFHALYPLQLTLIDRGFIAILAETSELIHYESRLFGPETLLIAVSQSGQSAEVLRLLQINGGRSALLAITNTPDSPLAKSADALILTQAGNEFSVSCKTYVTALLALAWLENLICERDQTMDDLRQAAPAVASYLAKWRDHVNSVSMLLDGIQNLFLVGRGPSLAAVRTGALIIKESDHFPAEGMSSAAFRHGPFEMLNDSTFVLVFSGDPKTRDLNQRLLEDVRQQGRGELVGVSSHCEPCSLPQVPGAIQPILEILPVEMMTLALAARAGREAGRFDLATKITTTE
jgi:glucosamine--fructose-6-phosphate aminotransferase (isomerizing)